MLSRGSLRIFGPTENKVLDATVSGILWESDLVNTAEILTTQAKTRATGCPSYNAWFANSQEFESYPPTGLELASKDTPRHTDDIPDDQQHGPRTLSFRASGKNLCCQVDQEPVLYQDTLASLPALAHQTPLQHLGRVMPDYQIQPFISLDDTIYACSLGDECPFGELIQLSRNQYTLGTECNAGASSSSASSSKIPESQNATFPTEQQQQQQLQFCNLAQTPPRTTLPWTSQHYPNAKANGLYLAADMALISGLQNPIHTSYALDIPLTGYSGQSDTTALHPAGCSPVTAATAARLSPVILSESSYAVQQQDKPRPWSWLTSSSASFRTACRIANDATARLAQDAQLVYTTPSALITRKISAYPKLKARRAPATPRRRPRPSFQGGPRPLHWTQRRREAKRRAERSLEVLRPLMPAGCV